MAGDVSAHSSEFRCQRQQLFLRGTVLFFALVELLIESLCAFLDRRFEAAIAALLLHQFDDRVR